MTHTNSLSCTLNRILDFLEYGFYGFPFRNEVDSNFFEGILEEFQDLDVESELKDFAAWALDENNPNKSHYRLSFRWWLEASRKKSSFDTLSAEIHYEY